MKYFVASIIACMLALSTMPAKAENGIGIQFGEPMNVALSLRLMDRFAIGAGWKFGNNGYLAADIDYWILKNDIEGDFDYYIGGGVGLGIGDPIRLNVHVPLGIQWMPLKEWEIFVHVSPGLQILHEVDFYFGLTAGVRYVF